MNFFKGQKSLVCHQHDSSCLFYTLKVVSLKQELLHKKNHWLLGLCQAILTGNLGTNWLGLVQEEATTKCVLFFYMQAWILTGNSSRPFQSTFAFISQIFLIIGFFSQFLTCFSRHYLGRDDAKLSAVNGFVSGSVSSMIFSSSSLSIYIAWKTLEVILGAYLEHPGA